MKIPDVEQIREADLYTIENEPISSIELMERAGKECYYHIAVTLLTGHPVYVFAGPGNNGGDGLVIARHLADSGVDVTVYILQITDKYSADFQINMQRLTEQNKSKIVFLSENDAIPELHKDSVIIDAIFGSGLSKPVTGFTATIIAAINRSNAYVFAIDIPSGLFADKPVNEKEGAVIHADSTLSLQFPKLSMLFAENDPFVGELNIIPIGLHEDFINKLETRHQIVDNDDIVINLKKRSKHSHKGTYGHALLIAGSYGKMGSAVLASRACLKTGAGLLTTHVPAKGCEIIQVASPETMVSVDVNEDFFTEIKDSSIYSAVGVGPGIGTHKQTQNALKLLIQNTKTPMVIDADALNILGENKTWLHFLPKGSILTPHPKEFERIAQKTFNSFERLEIQKDMSVKLGVYVVLKGAYTTISCPDGSVYFNNTGNPGMATAGSGDTLTGMILSLLAQNYHPKLAAIIGVYLHGLAGDLAVRKTGYESLIASDINNNIGKAFKKVKSDYNSENL